MMAKQQRIIKVGLHLLLLMVIASAPGVLLKQVRAQDVGCPVPLDDGDADNDGLTNIEECAPAGPLGIPSCFFAPEGECLDPLARDLFVILVPTTPSLLPDNPLLFISNAPDAGGLGIRTHVISPDAVGTDRSINGTQKAVRITESLDTDGQDLGKCSYGTPNGLDNCRVFTQLLVNFVNSVYADCGDTTTPQADIVAFISDYMRQVIAHESGHSLALTVEYNKRFGGHHYKPGSDVIMEQWVTYTCKRNRVSFSLPTTYADPSIAGVTLR